METLLLKSNSKKDPTLLLNIAKEKGLILEVAPKQALSNPAATAKPKISKQKLIMQLSKEVNSKIHDKLLQKYNTHNDSNYRVIYFAIQDFEEQVFFLPFCTFRSTFLTT